MNLQLGYGSFDDKFMFIPSIVLMYLEGEDMEDMEGWYLECSFLFLYFFIGFVEGEIE